jgi:hypothetical protein
MSIYKKYAVSSILLYLTTAYLLPSLGLFVFRLENPIYAQPDVDLVGWLFPVISVAISVLYFCLFSNRKGTYIVKRVNTKCTVALLSIIVAVMLAVSLSGLSGFRYGNTSIADQSSGLVFLFMQSSTVLDLIVFSFVFLPSLLFEKSQLKWRYLSCILLVLALLLSNTGIASSWFAAVCLIFVCFGDNARSILFQDAQRKIGNRVIRFHKSFSYKIILLYVGLIPVLGALMYFGWLYGVAVKTDQSLNEVLEWGQETYSSAFDFLEYLVLRMTPDYYSLRYALAHYAFATDFDVVSKHLFEPIRAALFRFDVLLGKPWGIERPEFGSLARLNVVMIANVFREREGTSTGPIAGFLYCFPFPLNFIVFSMFLVSIMNLFETIFRIINRKLNILGLLLFVYFMRGLLMSPIDLLLIFDSSTLYLMGLVLSCVFLVRKIKINSEGRSLGISPTL